MGWDCTVLCCACGRVEWSGLGYLICFIFGRVCMKYDGVGIGFGCEVRVEVRFHLVLRL